VRALLQEMKNVILVLQKRDWIDIELNILAKLLLILRGIYHKILKNSGSHVIIYQKNFFLNVIFLLNVNKIMQCSCYVKFI